MSSGLQLPPAPRLIQKAPSRRGTRRAAVHAGPEGLAVRDATPALRLEGITLTFGGVTALEEVDLTVARGEIRAIIGPNGAGKSSLINVISGIYPQDRGRVSIAGRGFRRVPTHKLAKLRVARTFQNLALFKGLTLFDNIAIGRRIRSTFLEQVIGIGRAAREQREAREATAEIIGFFDLGEFAMRPVGALPYGVQKRVELARALVARPELLLLDEPMAGMTPGEKQEMARFIRAARDEFGTTVILIEHDIGVVMGLSDRVAVLDHGRKIADGTPAEVSVDPLVIDAYLGVAHESEGEGGVR